MFLSSFELTQSVTTLHLLWIELWPEEVEGQADSGEEGGPSHPRLYFSFVYFLCPFLCLPFCRFWGEGERESWGGVVARELLRVTPVGDGIWGKIYHLQMP